MSLVICSGWSWAGIIWKRVRRPCRSRQRRNLAASGVGKIAGRLDILYIVSKLKSLDLAVSIRSRDV